MSNPTPRHSNRASWVALRTLRQKPKVVGETAAGEPVYEIQSVRLVLREDANHFNRILVCSKCGQEAPGPPVRTAEALDHVPHAVICSHCVRASIAPAFSAAAPAADPPPPPDDGRLGAMERRLTDLAGLLRRQRMDWEAALQERASRTRSELAALATEVKELARAQQDPARADVGAAEVARLVDTLEARIVAVQAAAEGQAAALRSDVAGLVGRGELEALDHGVQRLERTIEAGAAQAQASEVARRQVEGRLLRMEELFNHRLDRLAEQASLLTSTSEQLEAQLAQLNRITERVEELQARADAESARVERGAAAADRAREELARLEGQVGERLDGITERVARLLEAEGRRQEALDRHEAVLARLPEGLQKVRLEQQAALERAAAERADLLAALDSQRQESDTALREGLADLRSIIPAVPDDLVARLDDLEQHDRHRDGEVSELAELQGALDVGLGTLRSELAELRSAMRGPAGGRDDLDGRPENFVRGASPADGGQNRGRRAGRKFAETQMGALSEAMEELLREQRRLKVEVGVLVKSTESATAAAARASSQASSFGPVRSDVRALREELAAQQESLAALGAAAERLRPKPPARKPRTAAKD